MEGIFREFENENSLRSYPFAAGCERPSDEEAVIPASVFVDAVLYPVNPVGTVYLSSISEDGVFSVSDDTGVIMTGSASGSVVELFDTSDMKRHVGTLVASSEEELSEFAGRGSERSYLKDDAAFASGCVIPVVIDGVESLEVGEDGKIAGEINFTNGDNDEIRVSSGTLEDGRKTLRFDILPKPAPSVDSIRRIICVVDGQTPFRIMKFFDPENPELWGYNTVALYLCNIDKETVCSAAHREDSFEMADTCGCEKDRTEHVYLPETYQKEEVFIPPDESGSEGGMADGADNAFYLVVPNITPYTNPLSITLDDGDVVPKSNDPEMVISGNTAELAEGEILDDITSKGIVIQVPGLSGGMI